MQDWEKITSEDQEVLERVQLLLKLKDCEFTAVYRPRRKPKSFYDFYRNSSDSEFWKSKRPWHIKRWRYMYCSFQTVEQLENWVVSL